MYCMDDSVIGSYPTTTFNSNIDYLEYVPETQQIHHCHNTTTNNNIHFNHHSNNTSLSYTSQHYLSDNQNLANFIKYINANPEFKQYNQFHYHRLHNICWRRIYKNHHNLKTINPFTINWDKNSDITWLYAPKLSPPKEEEKEEEKLLSTGLECNKKVSAFGSMLSGNDDEGEDTSVEEDLQDSDNDDDDDDDNMSVSSIDSNSTNFSLSSRKDSTSSSLFEMDNDGNTTHKQEKTKLKPILKHSLKNTTTTTTRKTKAKAKKVSFHYIIKARELIENHVLEYNYIDTNCI